jgi:hypothetical protein
VYLVSTYSLMLQANLSDGIFRLCLGEPVVSASSCAAEEAAAEVVTAGIPVDRRRSWVSPQAIAD